MATVSYASTLPQSGDPQLSLLGRIAQAISSAVTSLAAIAVNAATGPTVYTETAYLASASRTATTTGATLTVPAGVVGIIVRLYPTAVPGVDTINISGIEPLTGRGFTGASLATATTSNHYLIIKSGWAAAIPAGTGAGSTGLPEKISFSIVHSGAGAFTYSVTYCWLTK